MCKDNVIEFSKFQRQEAIQNPYILKNLAKINSGQYEGFHNIGKIYEQGLGISSNIPKAIEMYEKFYEIHRSKRIKIDVIELLINIGNLYLKLGNKLKAAETYFNAGMEIIQNQPPKEHNSLLKKYKIEKLIRRTGCQDLI